jgi:hypothetical protein
MPSDETFLVEDFLQAITSQLDRTQDALVVKAVTRPLTYALREFSMELHVFVELDDEGNVRFRNSAPNEVGASSVKLDFTTITRPMIAENTISLAMTRSPNLEELGLAPAERRRLEQLGVRNAAQLQRLGSSAGATAVSRLSGVSLDRLRQALDLGRPRVSEVAPVPSTPPPPATPPPAEPPPSGTPPSNGGTRPGFPGRPWRDVVVNPPVRDDFTLRPERPTLVAPRPEVTTPRFDATPATPLPIAPGATRLRLSGSNLIGEDGPPAVRLNRRLLPLTQADDDAIEVDLGDAVESGRLEVELPTGEVLAYDLSVGGAPDIAVEPALSDDPWSREDGEP